MSEYLFLIPILPLVGAIISGVLHGMGGRNRNLAGPIATLAVFGSFVVAVLAFLEIQGQGHGETVHALHGEYFTWISIGSLQIPFALTVDQLSGFMALIVTGVGLLIHIYSIGYMSHDEGKARFFAYLNLFIFAMSLLILGSSFVLLFVGWEGVGAMSYLLIGFWYDKDDGWPAVAGQKAFIANRIGDLGFLIGMFLVFSHFGSLEFASIQSNQAAMGTWTGGLALGAALLLFLGATGKSAQIPLFVWLPDAMAGPTPVSALIHAATMVTAGVYMVARASFLFPPEALMVVGIVGGVTALFAGTMAIFQRELKKVLAYSTVSQLGYMFLACGAGAFSAAIFHVGTHAFFKALLFLGAGSVIHGMHDEADCFKMGGLRKYMPVTFLTFLAGCLALAGFPFTSGFFSKDEILWKTVEGNSGMAWTLWIIGIAAALLTAIYTFRLFTLVFLGKERFDPEEVKPHESSWIMTGPLIVLAVLALIGGVMGLPAWITDHNWIHHQISAVTTHVEPLGGRGIEPVDSHLEIWFALFSGLLAVFGIFVGWVLYRKGPAREEALAERKNPIWVLLYGKWFVDEIYEFFILKPMALLSKAFAWFDVHVVDGLVNAIAKSFQDLCSLNSRLQDGRMQTYALWMAGGAALALGYLIIQLL